MRRCPKNQTDRETFGFVKKLSSKLLGKREGLRKLKRRSLNAFRMRTSVLQMSIISHSPNEVNVMNQKAGKWNSSWHGHINQTFQRGEKDYSALILFFTCGIQGKQRPLPLQSLQSQQNLYTELIVLFQYPVNSYPCNNSFLSEP